MTDGQGIPLAVQVSAGQRHESTCFETTMEAVPVQTGTWPASLAGDKGYSYPRIRKWLQERSIHDVVAHRSDQRVDGDEQDFDRTAYRGRNVVERCVGWLKECRRMGTRFDKLAVNFLAMRGLAIISRYLRLLP